MYIKTIAIKHTVLMGGIVVCFILDRILKLVALRSGGTQGFFVRSLNQNLAFSLEAPVWVFTSIIPALIVLFVGLAIYHRRHKRMNMSIAYSALAIGALSNMFDRLMYEGVIDYIQIWFFPIFNLADVMIIGGLLILVFPQRYDESVGK